MTGSPGEYDTSLDCIHFRSSALLETRHSEARLLQKLVLLPLQNHILLHQTEHRSRSQVTPRDKRPSTMKPETGRAACREAVRGSGVHRAWLLRVDDCGSCERSSLSSSYPSPPTRLSPEGKARGKSFTELPVVFQQDRKSRRIPMLCQIVPTKSEL